MASVVGGNHTTSMYGNYLPKYNQRINVQSPFTIEIDGVPAGPNAFEVVIKVEKVATAPANSLVLQVVVTESDIQYSWQGQSELNHVERLMIPNQLGTPLDFSSGDNLYNSFYFEMNPGWVVENSEVIVFIQDNSSKEILQGTIKDFSDFNSYSVDASIRLAIVPQTVCKNSINPEVLIANNGIESITSLDIEYQINGGTPVTFNWTGTLAQYESEIVELDEIGITGQGPYMYNVSAINPNGGIDDFTLNNNLSITIEDAMNVTSPVSLALKLDDHPEEVTWELLNSAGDVLYNGGPYTTSGQFIIEQFSLDEMDCYAFKIYDEGGDGITGNGSYKLAYQGSMIFAEGKDFGFEDQIQFGIGLTGVEDQSIENGFAVYPNPVEKQAVIEVAVADPVDVQVSVFNTIGKLVYHSANEVSNSGKKYFTFDRNNLEAGIYFVQVKVGVEQFTSKIILK